MNNQNNTVPINVIAVCINDIYDANIREKAGCELKEMARGDWCVGDSARARACTYLVAYYHGQVKGAWEIDQTRGWVSPAQARRVGLPPILQARSNNTPHSGRQRACFLKDLGVKEESRVVATMQKYRLSRPFQYFEIYCAGQG